MKFDLLKTRKGRLIERIKKELKKPLPNVDYIVASVEEYEKDNLDTINYLKKDKTITTNRINGALKQTIMAHGPITKVLIGSATKRIYGSLICNPVKQKKGIVTFIKEIIKAAYIATKL